MVFLSQLFLIENSIYESFLTSSLKENQVSIAYYLQTDSQNEVVNSNLEDLFHCVV